MTFEELRKKHPTFTYEGFETLEEAGNLKVNFNFFVSPDIYFKPELVFPNLSLKDLQTLGEKACRNCLFHLGLIEILSYWKATCSPQIILKAGFLNEEQISWWQDLLISGLGEFFYTNQIDFRDKNLVSFKVESSVSFPPFSAPTKKKDLILFGGGKDSVVTLDIFQKSGQDFTALLLVPTQAAQEIVEKADCQSIVVSRTLDLKLLELNQRGYLNGHTPFSAYLAFLGIAVGAFYDFDQVIVSNEASSNEGNVFWLGQEINHQYSKTYQFENLFRSYCQKYLASSISYFSFLRPLLELQIAALFSKIPAYHQIFRSCNKGSKTNSWCKNCPKCAFTFLILYPFLGEKTIEILGENLLERKDLIPVFEGLLQSGNEVVKPFECVGTREEVKAAFYLGIKNLKEQNLPLPEIYAYFKDQIFQEPDLSQKTKKLLKSWNQENNLPQSYQNLLKNVLKEVAYET